MQLMFNSFPTRSLMRTIALHLFSLVLTSVHGQYTAEQVEQRLGTIESELYQDPVAAKAELARILGRPAGLPDSTLGRAWHSLSITLGMTSQPDSGIWAAKESIRLLPDRSIMKGSALKTLAILYRMQGDLSNAEEAIRSSLQLNDSLWGNKMLQAVTLQEYASLCLDRSDVLKATTLYLEALNILRSMGTTDPRASFTALKLRVNLAEAYATSRNYPFAIREFSETLPQLDLLNDKDGYIVAGIKLADAFIHTDQLQKADSMLQVLRPMAAQFDNPELLSWVLYMNGMSRSAAGQYAAALSHFRDAFAWMETSRSPLLTECATGLLQALHGAGGGEAEARRLLQSPVLNELAAEAPYEERLGFKKAALPYRWKDLDREALYAYAQELLWLADSVAANKERRSAARIQAEYQLERQQEREELLARENTFLKEREANKQRQLLYTLAIALLSLVLLATLFFRMRQRSKEKDRDLQAREQELRFQHDRRIWAEKERDLRDQLILQQKTEIMRMVEDAADMRSQLEQLVNEQQQERRRELSIQIEKSKQERHGMEHLIAQFNMVHPTFGASLLRQYPGLSSSDVQFCILCRMNLSTKEISSLFSIEHKSVYTRKYRIVEKMELAGTDEFDRAIQEID